MKTYFVRIDSFFTFQVESQDRLDYLIKSWKSVLTSEILDRIHKSGLDPAIYQGNAVGDIKERKEGI